MHLKARAVRRLFRIYPLYAMAPLVYAGLHWLQGETIERVNKHLLFDFTWETREVAFHFNPAFLRLLPEVEFYLAPPLVAALASRGGGRMVGGTAMGAVAGLMHLALELECNSRPRCLRHAVVLARIETLSKGVVFRGQGHFERGSSVLPPSPTRTIFVLMGSFGNCGLKAVARVV